MIPLTICSRLLDLFAPNTIEPTIKGIRHHLTMASVLIKTVQLLLLYSINSGLKTGCTLVTVLCMLTHLCAPDLQSDTMHGTNEGVTDCGDVSYHECNCHRHHHFSS